MGLKMIGQLHQNKSINEVPVIVEAISKVDFYSRHCSDRTNVMQCNVVGQIPNPNVGTIKTKINTSSWWFLAALGGLFGIVQSWMKFTLWQKGSWATCTILNHW